LSKSLTVLLDATAIPRNRGGVGRYLEGIVPPLSRDDAIRLIVVCQQHDASLVTTVAPGATVIVPTWIRTRPLRLIWEQLSLPRLARRHNVQVIHSPHYTFPLFTRRPRIVTLHDATFFSHPELHGRLKRIFFRTWTRAALHKAAAIIVPSRATADELNRYSRRRPAVFVAHHGVDSTAFHTPDARESDEARAIVGAAAAANGWLLFLGTLEPRKNVSALVRAYSAIATRHSPTDALPALVVAGAAGWDPTIDDAIASVRAPGSVVQAGYVDRAALPGLLGDADVVIYPSLGEGFGLPVLEAMACGAVVLTTRELALPEVGGDAVSYTGTSSPEIADALEALLVASPEKRSNLRTRAIARAGIFTWQASAHEHVRAYRKASL